MTDPARVAAVEAMLRAVPLGDGWSDRLARLDALLGDRERMGREMQIAAPIAIDADWSWDMGAYEDQERWRLLADHVAAVIRAALAAPAEETGG